MSERILVLGASGYVGSNLVARLLHKGYFVNATGRSKDRLTRFPWANHKNVQLSSVDVLNPKNLEEVCRGFDTAFYLIHSMNPDHKNFEEADRVAAQNMAEVSKNCGLKRIIYLGGLGDAQEHLSKHLRSRMEVSQILHAGLVPVTTLRAAMIIGKGSISFEILRSLVDRFPIMVAPRWIETESQPIALTNVLNYLIGCLENNSTKGEIYDIGGSQILSYHKLIDIYTRETKRFKRLIITVPSLSPTLSSHWIQIITPYRAYIATPLVEGLKNRLVCQDNRITQIIPQELFDCPTAIRLALKDTNQ